MKSATIPRSLRPTWDRRLRAAMLKVDQINVYYGNIQALKGVSLEVEQGEIVTLIGSNGAGKSTLLKSLSGLLKPKQGDIRYLGASIAGKPAQEIVKSGISHVPEGRRVFANMSVEENLELGAYLRKDKQGIRQDFNKVYELFPRLLERRKQLSGTLSGGEQQMLAMGRALMARPKLLLLDEPSMGLAPLLVKTIFAIIEEINRTGTTVLLVEQNANMALSIAHRAYVIEAGNVVISGTAAELQASDKVKQAYLGGH
jgi:branched-chain amino acid transport system ATP-binding protein